MKKFILFFFSFLLFFGCRGPESEREVVKIGVITPLTGEVASWGKIQQNATELAVAKINEEGGINGKMVKVIYEDCKASPREGVAAYRKLYQKDKCDIVVGVPASNVTLAIAPVANSMEKVLLTSGSTAVEVGDAGPYVFRIMPSDDEQSRVISEWAYDLGYRRIAVIYVENSWGKGLADKFNENFESLGGTIANNISTRQEASDFRTQLLRIRRSNPDAIYAPLHTRNAGLMIRQARELDINLQVFGADVYNTPDLIEAGGSAVNGVLYTQFSQGEGHLFNDFAIKYEEKYGNPPETYAGYCYDAIMIATKALAKDIDNPREALLNIVDYEGVTGITSFDGQTNAIGKTFEKWTVKKSKHERID